MKTSKGPLTAWVKAMDYLARRHHSEFELRKKLSKNFSEEEISPVLQEMKDRGWILPPEELSEKAAHELHRKKKGYLFINNFLRERGLPPVTRDGEMELEKAWELYQAKGGEKLTVQKLASLLKNRGFDTETIGKVIHEVRRDS